MPLMSSEMTDQCPPRHYRKGMHTRAGTVRLLALAVVAAAALVASPAPAATPAETKYATKIIERVNDIRAGHDRTRLKRDACLQRFAVKRAELLAKTQNTSLPHSELEPIQKKCGVGWVGENLAYGQVTAKQMVNMWMNSPNHRSNILLRHFKLTGVAVRRGGGKWWAAQVFGKKL